MSRTLDRIDHPGFGGRTSDIRHWNGRGKPDFRPAKAPSVQEDHDNDQMDYYRCDLKSLEWNNDGQRRIDDTSPRS